MESQGRVVGLHLYKFVGLGQREWKSLLFKRFCVELDSLTYESADLMSSLGNGYTSRKIRNICAIASGAGFYYDGVLQLSLSHQFSGGSDGFRLGSWQG